MSGGDGYLNLKTYRTISRMLTGAGLDHRVETMTKHYKIIVDTPMGERSFLLGHGPNPKVTTERESYRQIDKLIAEVRSWREAHADSASQTDVAQAAIALAEDGTPVEPALQFRDGAVYADSRNIAAVFGREHKTVLASIRSLECSPEFNRQNFLLVDYFDAKGERRPAYEITKDGFSFLVMGFTGANAARFKEGYIARFNEMEAALRRPGSSLDLTNETRRVIGGIIKSVVHSELGDLMKQLLPEMVAAHLAKQNVMVRHGKTAGQIWDRHGLPKLKSAAKWLGNRLEEMGCLADGRGERGATTVRLFDPDKADIALRNGLLIKARMYVAERQGQGRLRLLPPA